MADGAERGRTDLADRVVLELRHDLHLGLGHLRDLGEVVVHALFAVGAVQRDFIQGWTAGTRRLHAEGAAGGSGRSPG